MTPADLKAIRQALGLTQKALAARLGVPTNTWARWERGGMPVEKPTLLLLALDALACRAIEETRAAKEAIRRARS